MVETTSAKTALTSAVTSVSEPLHLVALPGTGGLVPFSHLTFSFIRLSVQRRRPPPRPMHLVSARL